MDRLTMMIIWLIIQIHNIHKTLLVTPQINTFILAGASLVAQMVKNMPAMQEAWVQSLDWEDPLEKGMATHSNILAWIIPWTEEPGRLQSMESQRIGHD